MGKGARNKRLREAKALGSVVLDLPQNVSDFEVAYFRDMPRHFELIGVMAVSMSALEADMAKVSHTVNVEPIPVDELVLPFGERSYLPPDTNKLREGYKKALRSIDKNEHPDIHYYMVVLRDGVKRLADIRNKVVHSYPRFMNKNGKGGMVYEHARIPLGEKGRTITPQEVEAYCSAMITECYLYQQLSDDICIRAAHVLHGAPESLVERRGAGPNDHDFLLFLKENDDHDLKKYYLEGWTVGFEHHL